MSTQLKIEKGIRYIISFSNQKGGVGKTTISVNVAHVLSHFGYRTLLIDADPQGNATKSLTETNIPGLFEALTEQDYQVKEVKENLFLLSGSIKLSLLEKTLLGEIDAYSRLSELLEQNLFNEFEYILIDTPPSLGVLTINSLTASSHIVVPMNPALYSMQGTNDLMDTVSKVKKNLNNSLNLLGVVINSFDSVPVITSQIKNEIKEAFGDLVFETLISKSIKVEEAIASLTGVIDLKNCKVKMQFISLVEELIKRISSSSPISNRNNFWSAVNE